MTNAGSIGGNATASSAFGVLLNAAGLVSNQSGGVISAATAVLGAVVGDTVINAGTITASETATGVGVLLAGGTLSVQSGGVVSAQSGVLTEGLASTVMNTGSIAGNATSGDGVEFQAGGVVSNQSGGVITGLYGVLAAGAASTVVNAGQIVGYSTSAHGTAIYVGDGGTVTNLSGGTLRGAAGIYGKIHALTVVNAGSISGNLTSGKGITLAAGGLVTNQTGGAITGNFGVRLSSVAATVINAGSIGGATIAGGVGVAMYHGGAVTNQAGGTISGFIGINAQTVAATVIDTGTIIGSGGTAVAFGTANDLLQFDPGNVDIQGTVNGGGGTNTLQFVSAAATGTLGGSASFYNFQTASVQAGASWVFAGSNTLGASVSLVDAGTLTNAGTLVVDPPVTVTGTFINSSVVSAPGTYTAFYIASGGVLTNTTSGTITAGHDAIAAAGTVTVTNFGSITGSSIAGIALVAGSVINGASGTTSAVITGGTAGIYATGAATVTNFGTIIGYYPGFGSAGPGTGVALLAGGSVENAGRISANVEGIFINNATGTVSDSGTIFGGTAAVVLAQGGSVSISASGRLDGTSGIEALNVASTITNGGQITGASGGFGVFLQSGGILGNTGGITDAFANAVSIQSGTAAISNYGTIAGGSSFAGIVLGGGAPSPTGAPSAAAPRFISAGPAATG